MLLEGVRLILEDLRTADRQADLFSQNVLKDEYARHVIGVNLKPPADAPKRKAGAAGARSLISARLKASRARLQAPYDTDLTMTFLWSVADGKARALIGDLVERRYYKRIFEVSPTRLTGARWRKLQEKFLDIGTRKAMQERLQEELYKTARGALQSKSEIVASLQIDGALESFERLAAEKCLFIIDMPLRGWMAWMTRPYM